MLLPYFYGHIFMLYSIIQVVMITGASSGLGEALAHEFYSCGCRVILVSRREQELVRVRNILMNTHQVCPIIYSLISKQKEYQFVLYVSYILSYIFFLDCSNSSAYCLAFRFN